ncbi:MAG: hypothetical protein ACKVQC_01695 [Elusimicrobiota bacterium]
MKLKNYLLLLSGILLSACQQQNSIQTYRLAKEQKSLPPPMENQAPTNMPAAPMNKNEMKPLPGMAPAASTKDIEWKTPSGWQEQTPSSMRVGSFLINGDNGQQADVSIVPLSGMAGGDLANINRWRDQIDLPPLTEAQLQNNIQTLKMNGQSISLVDFVSEKLLIDGKHKKRVIAATLPQGERTWFFKMMGEDKTVQQAKQQFIQFLSDIRLKNGK